MEGGFIKSQSTLTQWLRAQTLNPEPMTPSDASVIQTDDPLPLAGLVHIQVALLEPGLYVVELHFKDRKRLPRRQQLLGLVNILLSDGERLRRLRGIRKLEAQPQSQHQHPRSMLMFQA